MHSLGTQATGHVNNLHVSVSVEIECSYIVGWGDCGSLQFCGASVLHAQYATKALEQHTVRRNKTQYNNKLRAWATAQERVEENSNTCPGGSAGNIVSTTAA